MRPALQRLLARPSSVNLLRYLVGIPITPTATSSCGRRNRNPRRPYSSATISHQPVETSSSEELEVESPRHQFNYGTKREASYHSSRRGHEKRPGNEKSQWANGQSEDAEKNEGSPIIVAGPRWENTVPAERPLKPQMAGQIQRGRPCPGLQSSHDKWNENLWTFEELDFESNLLENQDTSRPRLLDHPAHKIDMNLWACFLSFRQRIYGLEGVASYFDAINEQKLEIPVTGHKAGTFWMAFLNLGFEDENQLMKLWLYANWMLHTTGKRWNLLYVKIVQHFLLRRDGQNALKWHKRLYISHPPGPTAFAEMFREVVFRKGDLVALKTIYADSGIRNVYGKVIPVLCKQQDFKGAFEWHSLCIQNKDLPKSSTVAESMIDFFAAYDKRKAAVLTKSLLKAGVPFAPRESTVREPKILSREMMNRIHGETFNIPAKAYNDDLGARWFATSWIPLDVSINGVAALGVDEIGPLSLQAIALREMDPESVVKRIEQLRENGISIGQSVFSRAVAKFAAQGWDDHLRGILQSDQHPDALEDWKLQEALLASYAKAKDWPQYRRTLQILLIDSKTHEVDKLNVLLRCHVSSGDVSAIHGVLSKMHAEGINVSARTISYLVMKTLRRRQTGRRPVTLKSKFDDLDVTINILKGIMLAGSHVGVVHWRELLKRLGMLGLLDQLYPLCSFLASWYGPVRRGIFDGCLEDEIPNPQHKGKHYRKIPVAIPTSHPMHPLKILFSVSLQKAIVEWGFIRGLRGKPARGKKTIPIQSEGTFSLSTQFNSEPHLDVTSGIKQLQRLERRGVKIDMKAVRSAIFHRLVAYYGLGRSKRRSNRVVADNNPFTFDEMIAQIDDAMGSRAFPRINDLRQAVEMNSLIRTQRLSIKAHRRLKNGLKSLKSVRKPYSHRSSWKTQSEMF